MEVQNDGDRSKNCECERASFTHASSRSMILTATSSFVSVLSLQRRGHSAHQARNRPHTR